MELNPGILLVGISIGGAVFVCFVLLWFITAYLKRPGFSEQSSISVIPSSQQLSPLEDQRSHQRVAVTWQVSFAAPTGMVRGHLKDISLGGAFIICPLPMPLNKRFPITIHLPDSEPLELKAEVVWSNQNVPEERIVHRGMGIRFVDNEEWRQKRLSETMFAIIQPVSSPEPHAKENQANRLQPYP
jgi:hypothetical protein